MSQTAETINHPASALIAALQDIAGPDNILTDEKSTDLFSHDVYYRPDARFGCIVRPANAAELSRIVAAATSAGVSVTPRGGGMSYTAGYVPEENGSVSIDLGRMNRVLEINETDMYVTVEAGCTWVDLHDTLKPKGLRTPFWGPLSGLKSTIGGGLSQNNAFFGGGLYGTTSESILSLKVVLADGTLLDTGSASTKDGTPFYRFYGPDMAGMFMGDTGAMGVKAEATFRLMEWPEAEDYASFAFPDLETSSAAMSDMARAGVGCELFGFDPGLMKAAMDRGNWGDNLKALSNVASSQTSLLKGVTEAAKIAVAGKNLSQEDEYTLHLVCEGRSAAAVAADIDKAKEIASRHGGREIENSIPKVVRAKPFNPVNNMIGPKGERWIPTHGLLPHSKAVEVWKALQAVFEAHAADIELYKIATSFLTCTVSSTVFLIEPVMTWPDELLPMHHHYVEPGHMKSMETYAANAEAAAAVTRIRDDIIKVFSNYQAVHFQIGKAYPYREGRTTEGWAFVQDFKNMVDPNCRINPGSLGFRPHTSA